MGIGQKNLVNLSGDDKGEPTPKKAKEPAPTQAADRDLRTRIAGIFARIADASEARGDQVLADILREDMQVMAVGLVSLTRPVRALRAPLLFALGVIEPVMAFSRTGRIMLERLLDRRAARQTEDDPGTPGHDHFGVEHDPGVSVR